MKKEYLDIKHEKGYTNIAKQIVSKPSSVDIEFIKYFLYAIINRAMVTSKGIETLLRVENYESALPLLRVLLDCGLQVKAVTMIDNREEYYKTLGNVKGKKGKGILGEGTVAKSLDKDEWTSGTYDLYDFLCKQIHFSPNHVGLLFNADMSISIGRLVIKENADYAAQIKQCYDDINQVVIDILEYFLRELWPKE